jgi:hypothetical protein
MARPARQFPTSPNLLRGWLSAAYFSGFALLDPKPIIRRLGHNLAIAICVKLGI